MKSFHQFITEAYDKELEGQASRAPGEGGRIRSARKKSDGYLAKQQIGQKKKVKAVGGGKTAPAKDYKDRKDIGTNKPRSKVEQQPEKERGSAALSAKAAQKKAYLERKAKEKGAKTKTRTELLTTKTTKAVDPKYKPQKASGLTHRERLNKVKKGEKALRDMRLQATGKTKESELKHPITGKEVTRRNKKNK